MQFLIYLLIISLALCGQVCMGKTGRTMYTDEQMRFARENVAKYDWAKKSLYSVTRSVQWVLNMPDEDLWNFIPPADQPRALNVHFGADCPVHGSEIHKVGAHYPWTMDREHPFKVKCPVGGEVYPSNDFKPWGKQAGLDANQKYADDGFGWVDEKGQRYWFVGHYIFWQRWRRDILPAIPNLAFAYFVTGDARYAHKAAVMLARIASEYPKMDYRRQAYHNGSYPAPCSGKILDLDWEGSGTIIPLSSAYDQIYDALDKDPDLEAFLAGKGVSDVRDFIERNFLQEAAGAIMDGVVHGNMNFQEQLAEVALVLDNHNPAKGYTTDQMVDWIMNGGGEMNTLIYNGVSRDGAGSEESIGYTTIWTVAFYELAEKLKPLGYDLFANPRLRKMTDFYLRTAVADSFSPNIGDAGEMIGSSPPVWGTYIFRRAYDTWHDPAHAQVLNRIGWPDPSIYEDVTAFEQEKKKAEAFGKDVGLSTRDIGGYGLAVLESGSGERKRAATMFYGSSGAWHGHFDRLNIGMWIHGRAFLPDIGYPAHWGEKAEWWVRSTPSHYCVLMDENRQEKNEGHLNLLASSQEVQVMDASADDAYPGTASLYRRTVAMVDASAEDSYLVDFLRVTGGGQHDYSFHGLPFGELSLTGVDLGPARTAGTLMGEDVEFGRPHSEGMKTGGYQYLFNPRRGNPQGKWSANWMVRDKGIGLRWTMLPGSAKEVIVANCEPEPKPGYPEKMEYILARNKGGESTYVSVIEPYLSKPFIKRIEPLVTTRAGFAGVRVDCEGRTDHVMSALDASVRNEAGGITLQGEFGSITEDALGLKGMFLANGSELAKGGYAIRTPGTLTAKITAIDYRTNAITLDRKLPIPQAAVGQVVVISNLEHSASYTVTEVKTRRGRSVLHFGDMSLIEGIGEIKAVDDETKTITSDTRFSGYGIKWMGKQFPGRALVNEAMTEAWPITAYDDGAFTVGSKEDISPRLTDADGDKRNVFYIAEAAIGDEVMIPTIVSISRTEKDTYKMKATVPFELTLPCHGFAEPVVECQTHDTWKPMESEIRAEAVRVRFDGNALSDQVVIRIR